MAARPSTLQQDYLELKESGNASDFPGLLANLMGRRLIEWFNAVPADWRQYAAIDDTIKDYRPHTLVMGAEAEDLLFVGIGGVYQDSKEFDRFAQVQITKWGRKFTIGREVILNDDLGYIQQQPKRMARAAQRTISKSVPQNVLEANPNTFDGQALFSTTHVAGSGTYSNLQTGAGSALGITSLTTAYNAMAQAKAFDGVLRPVVPTKLVVPVALKLQALALIHSMIVVMAGGQTPDVVNPNLNQVGPSVLESPLTVVADRYLVNQTAWYLFADADEVPVVTVGFLNGKQTPDLLALNPQMYNIAGGDDPYTVDFDEMVYKCRLEFGLAPVAWWGGYKSSGA